MSIKEVLKVYQFDKKRRFGLKQDGGYVIGELNDKYDCYISAGISDEESFSRDFINEHNMNEYNSYGFDGTVNSYPYKYTKKITFIHKNIGGIDNESHTNLSYLINKYDNIFLKMDIEGGEYPWLLNISEDQLKHFKQIVIEFHGITNNGWGCSHIDKVKCITKLTNTHYIIHAHANNNGQVIQNIPDVIEITFVNKNYFDSPPSLNKTPLPIPNLDFPNMPDRVDVNLNTYPFVHI
jgi:hypothetical protein